MSSIYGEHLETISTTPTKERCLSIASTTDTPATSPGSPFGPESTLNSPLLGGVKQAVDNRISVTREQSEVTRHLNVKLMYAHTTFMTLYQSICCWNVFDAYLAILATNAGSDKANTWVGAAESVTGLATLICAVPCGILADRMSRVTMVRVAGCLGLLASCTSLIGFLMDSWHVIFVNMALWGLFTSLMGTAAEAIFADSCQAGERSKQTALKGSLQTVGLAVGPLIMWGVFRFLGDTWTIETLHVPLVIGCLLGPLAAIPCFWMEDVRNFKVVHPGMIEENSERIARDERVESNIRMLRERKLTNATYSDHEHRVPASSLSIAGLARPRGESRAVTDAQLDAIAEDRIERLILHGTGDINEQIEREENRFKSMTSRERAVPYILTIADFITEVGAGMTVRFFALFFIADFGVKPTTMSLIFGIYPALVALAIHICLHISQVTGRAQISWIFQACGIVCLLGMVYISNLPVLVAVFFARSCFQNAAYPVDRSILYDAIPSSKRGRWASIASLTTMTWSGSAVIGGWITDGHDYRYTFVITAIIYAIGLVVYTPLVWLVPRETGARKGD